MTGNKACDFYAAMQLMKGNFFCVMQLNFDQEQRKDEQLGK